MRGLLVCLAAAALAGAVTADNFRTGLVGLTPDWASAGGDQGCDVCSGGHQGSSGYRTSSSSHNSRYSSSGDLSPRYRPRWAAGERLGSGLSGRSGAHRRTYHFSSEESEYTFSNGTHSTTITSKRSSEGRPEFHLKMTRLRDGAVIESTVLSEAEYRQRRASLGLTGSDGSFGFESLGGGGDLHGLSARRLSGDALLTDLERRLGQRRGSRGRHSTSSFSSEESFYSFSNGTHTTSITGRRNSDGVREYRLELIRDSDQAVLDRATISEAEYNRRRQSMTSGRGFDDVFDIHGIHGSRSAEFDSRYDSRSRSQFDSRSESEFGSRSGDRRPTSGSSGGSRSTYFREERTETRRQEGSEACSCVARVRCELGQRVLSAEALMRCRSGEVCCRNPVDDRHPLLPVVPPVEPREPRPRRPVAEPQVSDPDCSCVPRDSCTFRDRDYSLAGLQSCRHPMVCCRRQLSTPAPAPAPLMPTPAPAVRRPTRRPAPDPAFVQQERDLFRDIVQHVDTDQHPVQRSLDVNALQTSLSHYDDAHEAPSTHRRTEHSRTEHSRTVTSGVRPQYEEPLRTADGAERTSSSSRRYSYSSRSSSDRSSGEHTARDDDYGRRRPVDTGDGVTHSRRTYSYQRTTSGSSGTDSDLLSGTGRGLSHLSGSDDSAEQGGGSRVVSNSRRYSERRVVSSDDSSEEDQRPLLDGGSYSRHESSRTSQQHSAQQPVDLPGPEIGTSSSSRRYSYRRSSSSSSQSGDQLLGADGAGQHLLTDRHSGQPVVTSSSRQYSSQLTVSGGTSGDGGLLADSDLGLSGSADLSHGSGGDVASSSRRYSERRVVSGDTAGAGADLGLSGGLSGGHSGGYSSGSRYSSSSSWSSRSESGSLGGQSLGGHSLGGQEGYQTGGTGSSGGSSSSYQYQSQSSSSQTVPAGSSSSYWSRYSQQSQRHRRGLTDLFRSVTRDEPEGRHGGDRCVCVRFDRCSDGNLFHHGADLLDFSIGSRKQCSGFRVCCDTPPEVLQHLQSTPGLQEGVITSVPTSGLQRYTPSPLAPRLGGAEQQPCVCVAPYLCQGGQIAASQQLLVDMRQVSSTGRCNYEGDGQVCCPVPWAQVQPTPPPPPCTCVPGQQCRQQDVLTRYTNANAPTCPGTQVCCTRPPPGYDRPAQRPDPEYNMYLFCKSYPLSVACTSTHRFNFQPTITPSPYFNPLTDARALKEAFGVFRVDDDVLINILTRRTFQQRALISREFKRITGDDLADEVESYTSGNYEDLLLELLDGASMADYLARRLHQAMDRIGTDEDAVLETLISSTNDEIAAIKPYFYAVSGHTLEDDVADDFSGDLRDILVALANGTRDDSLSVDRRRASEQAAALRQAGDARLGTEEETFKYYLTHENYAQLALVFSEYEQLTGETFEAALEDEFSRHTEDAVLAIVEATKNLPGYFAGRLYDALWSRGPLGKDDSVIRRILISRAERDLGSIAREYHRRYGNSLRDDLETKATGDYEDALVSLLGETP